MQRLAPAPLPAGPPAIAGAPQPGDSGAVDSPSAQLLRRCIAAAADAMMGSAAELDAVDRAVGDGDCGATLATAANAIKKVNVGWNEKNMVSYCLPWAMATVVLISPLPPMPSRR